jgi:L,D-transpeptidase ErfK/SrfK
VNPTWDVPASIREEARRAGRSLPMKVPPGPNNPLGAYWLGLSVGSVGIHGTNAPTSVYQAITHGCIRLHPVDIAALFGQVQVGTKGLLLYQPVLVGVDGDHVFVEAHRDVYRRGPHDPLEFVRARTRELGVFDKVDWDLAAEVIRQRAGVARTVTRWGQLFSQWNFRVRPRGDYLPHREFRPEITVSERHVRCAVTERGLLRCTEKPGRTTLSSS